MTIDYPLNPSIPSANPADEMLDRIDILSSEVWEGAATRASVMKWLDNFDGSCISVEADRLCALHLLANFNYFGMTEIRVLLKSLYRDFYRYPIIQDIRSRLGNTLDSYLVNDEWRKELNSTRFLGMGNPSESGSHLLYYFRQENALPKDLFVHSHELVDGPFDAETTSFIDKGIRRLVFIDDVLGSGQQAVQYSRTLIPTFKKIAKRNGTEIEILYLVLFGKESGLTAARSTSFDRVDAVHEIQNTELAFSSNSRIYIDPPDGISLAAAKKVALHYGNHIFPTAPYGYRNGQLLVGFHHNTPDNTLPIIWCSGPRKNWHPIFKRYGKLG